MTCPKKLNKPWYDTTFDDTLDGRVFLFRKKFAEFGSRVQLTIGIIGENARNHLFSQLKEKGISK